MQLTMAVGPCMRGHRFPGQWWQRMPRDGAVPFIWLELHLLQNNLLVSLGHTVLLPFSHLPLSCEAYQKHFF